MSDFIGQYVRWEKSGKGAGTFAEGYCVGIVPKGTTNKEAVIGSDRFKPRIRDLAVAVNEKRREQDLPPVIENPDRIKIRPKYIRFALDTINSTRALVIVEKEAPNSPEPRYWIYAPNVISIDVI